MIVVTGGAGFIGSNLVKFFSVDLNKNVCVVDNVNQQKIKNINKIKNILLIQSKELKKFLKKNKDSIRLIIHMGAITSTTVTDAKLIIKNNIDLSIFLWEWCSKNKVRLFYASSAATYGNGKNGFLDKQSINYLSSLHPLNLYGWSKQIIDRYIINQVYYKRNYPPQWVGLKFFNVYGPNEYHKKDMKSIVCKIFEKIKENREILLFRSHNKLYKDGEQLRDFIYVKDIIKLVGWLEKNKKVSGIFNVGSGKARSFKDLAYLVIKNTNAKREIKYINTPKSIRENYQYLTESCNAKLKKLGFNPKFYSLEEGIADYINNYLIKKDKYL